ncbi:probable rRNA-processing protein EBP2 isoform X2 [Hylaeus volcanicus]|uniref:probable rRNA-processing protein EBP2 isoform X2 n=1 Tax=Hylaeus volcanicus TaxID=313075 RepID=UPI0023B88279|nr:probable rRNA-processing protein EBP2 isoform X2 [Hylaeus volcanicus]
MESKKSILHLEKKTLNHKKRRVQENVNVVHPHKKVHFKKDVAIKELKNEDDNLEDIKETTNSESNTCNDLSVHERIRLLNIPSTTASSANVQFMSLEDGQLLANASKNLSSITSEPSTINEESVNNIEALERCLKTISYSIDSNVKRVPWIDHLSLTLNRYVVEEGDPVLPEEDQKRESVFQNMTEMGVKESLKRLFLLKLPFSRPNDFFAEMLKSDQQMQKVQSNLLVQQEKIKAVEKRKKKQMDKKLVKKQPKSQLKKQEEKRKNLKQLEAWKQSKYKTPL